MLHSAFCLPSSRSFFFFFNDPATPEISPLPLHAALPISRHGRAPKPGFLDRDPPGSQPRRGQGRRADDEPRSEEHTSELQSLAYLVCRLLLEKKKKEYNKRGRNR